MASVPASTPTASNPAIEHPLRNPNYRLWLVGGTISFLGDQFYMLALPWLILQQTGSAVAMGAVMMAGSIPRALLMLMGGAVSDRISARKIMMTTATARTICVAVIGVLVWFGILHMWELYALAVIFGVADAFAAPASTAYMPSLVAPEQLVAASSVGQSAAQLTTIVGPVPAGFVIKTLGVAWAFFVDAISFLFIIGALWKLPDPPQISGCQQSGMALDCWRVSPMWARDVPLRSLMLLAMTMNFCFTGPVSIGLTYLIKTRFGSPAILGTLMSVVAVGSLLGALLAGVWKIRRRGILILVVAAVLSPLPGIHWIHGKRVEPWCGAICDRRYSGLDECSHRRLGDAADRGSGARASGKRAHARHLRNHAHLFRRCRIPDCVEPEVHVSDCRPGNVDNCCRGIVAETGPGDSIEA